MAVCAAMVLIWLLRWRRKGPTAYFMTGAFAAFGGLLYSVKQDAPTGWRIAFGCLLILLLIADFAFRSSQRPDLGNDP